MKAINATSTKRLRALVRPLLSLSIVSVSVVLQVTNLMENEAMRNRQETLLWMKDLIEHMNRCHEQLQWASDSSTQSFLTDSLMVDLSECKQLCEELKARPRSRAMAATDVKLLYRQSSLALAMNNSLAGA